MIKKYPPSRSRVRPAPDQKKESAPSPRRVFRAGEQTHKTTRSPLSKHLPAKHTQDLSKSGKLRFVPVGGLEEIGLNMMFFEYQNEIVVIDAGLMFPVEETPGIDFIIPNVSYLEAKKANVHALIITHGHYDHIGAIPYVMDKLGNPPIYTTSITKAIIEKRQEDFPNRAKMNIITVKNGDKIKLSNHFEAEFFGIAHTIPESTAINLKTPVGNVVNLGDFKIEYDVDGTPLDVETMTRIGKDGVLMFTVESTNADRQGKSESERTVEKNLEELIGSAEGRIIVAMFASVLTRIGEVIKIAEKLGRIVALSGYSMKANVEIAKRLGFIKCEPGTIIPVEEIHKYKDNKILILSTGAQGESNASLRKIINGEHRFIRIKPGDTVMFSASVIPGNELSVQNLKDNLARQGALIFASDIIDIHASGHAPKEDLKLAMKLLNPKFLAPIHGYFYKRSVNAKSGVEVGIPRKNIFLLDNGQVAEITKDTFEITKEEIPASYVMVDGLGVGDVEEVVLRDRKALANEGMVVIILALEKKTSRLIKSPDIISRGFIYIKENQEVLEEVRKKVRSIISRLPNYQPLEPDYLKTLIRDQVGQFLYTKTKRRPMILPVVIEV
ncbi:MAG: ribonuclease J [Candidatus Liptonbacteria bacterium]|nr:ribonuclease J [Candidatus Liptonbacteria bacterium]